MKKILLIHQIFVTPDEPGGTRHYELAKHLVQRGFSVCVIASRIDYLTGKKKDKKREIRDGIEIFYCAAFQSVHRSIFSRALSFLSFAVSSLWTALTIKKIDVIWGTSPPIFQAITGFVVAKIRRKKFYFEVRDLWVDFAKELGLVKSSLLITPVKIWEKILYKFSDKIIVNSPGFVPYVERHVAPEKVAIIPNGVITKDFEIQQQTSFFRDRGVKEQFIAIYIGNLGIANDIENILAAAERLQQQEIAIVLMGGGMRFSSFAEEIKTQQLNNVYLFPPQSKSQIPSILAEASLGIATLKDISLFKTTYPNKVFDYMAAKLPTVLAIDGAIREVIENANGGVFVPPGDSEKLANAIVDYSENLDIVKEQGENAFRYVKKYFEREVIAEELVEMFRY
ncbi:glycosyltransferase family 4 protein [Candidatus Uabimicrobium amorphum]|uniref:Glycosyltransferase WbuB n=1 Tax=Uabimicrobium amorphum TaxID=2596890 RepID=A0A5S9IJC6_UABAM|nr:glycosyltransferase family 4 protein [Candidatus Uabimicrobium amorphum]BBM81685.1 glycosyltransferase WbuB [Candidatus Uabimicrobium amorphum]